MPNRQLNDIELASAAGLLALIRNHLDELSGGDPELAFAFRRKLYKELIHDERGKPAHRNKIKMIRREMQGGLCALCNEPLPEKYCVLDRLHAPAGYTPENTRLVHQDCDHRAQAEKGYV